MTLGFTLGFVILHQDWLIVNPKINQSV